MSNNNWVAVSAASALSLGVIAGGAASVANAMPLIENATGLTMPAIDNLVGDGSDSNDLEFDVTSDSIVSPVAPVSPTSPATTESPAPPLSPVSVDSPPTPASPVSIDSPPTPPSPASVASPPSPASPATIESPASADAAD